MKKFRLYYDKDKETTWLNEMAAQGYAMTSFVAGIYSFEACTPSKYIYQVDFKENFFEMSESYREFMRENEIEIVQTWGFWIFLRKLSNDGLFLLYTDIDSQIEHYTKIRNMFKGASLIMIICLLIQCICIAQEPDIIFLYILLGIACAFVFMILHTAFKTNQKINELKEQKGEPIRPLGKPSLCLIAGLLLNSVALVSEPLTDIIEYPLRILAIALIVIGIIQTFSNKPEN